MARVVGYTDNKVIVRDASGKVEQATDKSLIGKTISDEQAKELTKPTTKSGGVSRSEANLNDTKTPFEQTGSGTGVIITSEKGSNVYDVSGGYENPKLIGTTTTPIKTTGKVTNIGVSPEAVYITQETTTAISETPKPVSNAVSQDLAKELVEKNLPQLKNPLEGYQPTMQTIPRTISPQETATSQFGQTQILNPLGTSQEALNLKIESLNKDFQTSNSNIGYSPARIILGTTPSPEVQLALGVSEFATNPSDSLKRYSSSGQLVILGAGIGVTSNPVDGLISFGKDPVGTIKGTGSAFMENPNLVVGQFIGGGVQSAAAGSFIKPVSPQVNKFIVGDKDGFVRRTDTFVTYDVYGREQFPAVQGTVPFNLDTSGALKTSAIQSVTGEKYVAQANLYGDILIKPEAKPKGFLAEQDISLDIENKPPKPFGDVNIKRVYEPVGQIGENEFAVAERIKLEAQQTKLRGQNIMFRPKNIEATNPRYKIIDFVNPEKNFIEVRGTQATLFEPTVQPTTVTRRNVLAELYGKKTFVELPENTVTNNNLKTELATETSTPIEEVSLRNTESSSRITFQDNSNAPITEVFVEKSQGSIPNIPVLKLYSPQKDIKPATLITTIPGVSSIPSIDSSVNVKNINTTRYLLEQKPQQDQEIVQETRQGIRRLTTPIQTQAQLQDQETRQVLRQEYQDITPVRTPDTKRFSKPVTELRDYSKPSFDFSSPIQNKYSNNRNVQLFVRQKGKFNLKGTFANEDLATSRGKDIVKNTTAASYKLVESGKTLTPNFGGLNSEFTRSKRDSNVVVQRNKYRISSLGEKIELRKAKSFKRLI